MIHQYYKISHKNAIKFTIETPLWRASMNDSTPLPQVVAARCPDSHLTDCLLDNDYHLSLVPLMRIAPSYRRACAAHNQGSASGIYAPPTPGRMPARLPSR